MRIISPSLGAKMKGMPLDKLVQVVIFIKVPSNREDGKETPVLADKSALNSQISHDNRLLLNQLIKRLEQIGGDKLSLSDVKPHETLGALSASLPVSVIRELASESFIELIVEDFGTELMESTPSV